MGKSKYLCSKYNEKHFPPTGKKCQHQSESPEQCVVSKKSTEKRAKNSMNLKWEDWTIQVIRMGALPGGQLMWPRMQLL